MNSTPRIPVSVLTGFLGSGKTTLLNSILKSHRWADTAVIVNEIGEIALDHLLIESSNDNVQVLSSGCLCCTLRGDLREMLADLFVRRVNGKVPPFTRVIVETTGLANPGPVANSLVADSLLRAEFRFAAIVTTVDAMQGGYQLDHYVEARHQVALADTLIVTKTDLVTSADKEDIVGRLQAVNPLANLVTSIRGGVDPDILFLDSFREGTRYRTTSSTGSENGSHGGLPAQQHTDGTRTWSFVIEHPVHWSGLASWMAYAKTTFGDRLLRVKGIFTIANEKAPVAIHGVGRFFHPPERLENLRSHSATSRLVCIARDIDETQLRQSLDLFNAEESSNGI